MSTATNGIIMPFRSRVCSNLYVYVVCYIGYGMAWYGMRYGVVWCGVVWCGVVWCGVVCCGVVWCGMVWWVTFCTAGTYSDYVTILGRGPWALCKFTVLLIWLCSILLLIAVHECHALALWGPPCLLCCETVGRSHSLLVVQV